MRENIPPDHDHREPDHPTPARSPLTAITHQLVNRLVDRRQAEREHHGTVPEGVGQRPEGRSHGTGLLLIAFSPASFVGEHEVPLPEGAAARNLVPKEPFCARMSVTHPLAGRDRIELADLAGETWMTLVEDGDGGPQALVGACQRAGFTPALRYRIADRKMHYDLIAAGRVISVSQPTASPVAGTVLRPLVGDLLTGRIRLAWNRAAVSERRAGLLYRAAALAYLDNVPRNAFLRK
ncbi:LysR substrate-binding domain-containing protein [Streptomyces sp. NPDC013012]|uniref:LysR substrate-binding domain-containing protein n=1 Tax=Streptomyces sp. NPDC013012 TaxID=3364860 RepID=UPI003687FA6F